MNNPSQNIAVLGIGLMGFPIGKRLCEAGYPVTVWNRSAAKAERLLPFGAQDLQGPSMGAPDGHTATGILDNTALWNRSLAPDVAQGASNTS